ncbi:hypothetical protein D3C71_1680630 [compost metagenome]
MPPVVALIYAQCLNVSYLFPKKDNMVVINEKQYKFTVAYAVRRPFHPHTKLGAEFALSFLLHRCLRSERRKHLHNAA